MLSVIIATLNDERVLVPTLATLVAGAAAGTLRDVIVVDGGSTDATVEVADIAGCDVIVDPSGLASRLRGAAAKARANWLMFLRPGMVLDATWTDETSRFLRQMEARGLIEARVAVFRRAPDIGSARPLLVEALSLLRSALGSKPHPEQGLIVNKQFYERLGGHRDAADPETDLLSRIGRRRIALLRSGAFMAGADD